MLRDNAGHGKDAYAPGLIHDRAMRFIEENQDKPFLPGRVHHSPPTLNLLRPRKSWNPQPEQIET